MKRHLPIILVTAILLLHSPRLFSQDENYDAVYLQLSKTYTLNSDGSMDYRYVKKQKLQTYRAFSSLYGESFIVYNPDYQELKIREAFTVMADGKKVSSPQNAFNEVLPAFAAGAPFFNKLREMVVTHTGLERNAVENLDYSIHSKNGFYPALMGNELLAESEPVKELILSIKVPSTVVLRYNLLNSGITPSVTLDGNFKVFTWTFKDVAAIPAEENAVNGNGQYPRLFFSTATDRVTLYTNFLALPAFEYAINEEMKSAVFAVMAENKDPLGIALKLQEKVINEFKLWPVPMRFTGFTCRPATETWNSGGGTLAEKAVLLCALLKAADLDADPVFIVKKAFYSKQVATLLDVDDIAVAVSTKESGVICLSLTTQNSQNLTGTLSDRFFFTPKRDKKPDITETGSAKNKTILRGSFTFGNKMQLSGDLAMTFGFSANPWLVLVRDKNKAKNYAGGGLSSADLKELKIANIGQDESFVTWSVQKEKPFKKDTNLCFFTLPYLATGIESFGIHILPKERFSALEIPALSDEDYEFSFVLPKGMNVPAAGLKKSISNKAGKFDFSVEKQGDKVTVKKSIRLEMRTIPVEAYPDFKALMDCWNSEPYREVIFTE